MKKLVVGAAAALAAVTVLAGPAAAHNLVVDPPGSSETKVGWVGGPAIPGEGQGLIPGGQDGEILLTPAHGSGLNQACRSVRSKGRAAADIWGPPGPGDCPHGTF